MPNSSGSSRLLLVRFIALIFMLSFMMPWLMACEFITQIDAAPDRTGFDVFDSPTNELRHTPANGGVLSAWFIDVGQGDCIFLESPSGKTMLIDSGENKYYDDINEFLTGRGAGALDVVIATHPHSDHIGGMQNIIQNYSIGASYMTDAVHTTATFERMLDALEDNDVSVYQAVAGEESFIEWDSDIEVRILSPFDNADYKDLNDESIMIRVKYGDTSILFTGDAEIGAENIAMSRLPASFFKADILKLGHHGSSTSSGEAFLNAVSPQIAVGMMGKENKYGHPHQETLDLLERLEIKLYRTDLDGTVCIQLDGRGINVSTGDG